MVHFESFKVRFGIKPKDLKIDHPPNIDLIKCCMMNEIVLIKSCEVACVRSLIALKSAFPLLKEEYCENAVFKAILSLEMHSLGSKVTIVVMSSVNNIYHSTT
ncbi:MAG: hypothetical protein ACTSPW_15440 [Promethearchaeota archaeon]